MAVHANHARDFTPDATAALRRSAVAGVPLLGPVYLDSNSTVRDPAERVTPCPPGVVKQPGTQGKAARGMEAPDLAPQPSVRPLAVHPRTTPARTRRRRPRHRWEFAAAGSMGGGGHRTGWLAHAVVDQPRRRVQDDGGQGGPAAPGSASAAERARPSGSRATATAALTSHGGYCE